MFKTVSFSILNNTSTELQVDNIVFKLKCFNLETCELMVIKAKVLKALEKVNNKNDKCKEGFKIKTCINNACRKMYALVTFPISHNF